MRTLDRRVGSGETAGVGGIFPYYRGGYDTVGGGDFSQLC